MASANELDEHKMFGPLSFTDTKGSSSCETDTELTCLLCDETFDPTSSLDLLVKHLFEVHNLVIEEIQHIENLLEYLQFWKDRFRISPIEEIIPAVKIGSTGQVYFLISTLLKEDKEIRHKLKLDSILKVQEFERTDCDYAHRCLFCKLQYKGSRTKFIDHLISDHNLYLGDPQNLVFIEELVSKIESKMNSLTCLYCEKIFPERSVLKEHMRKKLHKRIHSCNKEYDKYFIKNYLDGNNKVTRNRPVNENVLNDDEDLNKDEEYYDWSEKEDFITCLFCHKRDPNINTLCLHMDADHDFDFVELTQNFTFYQKIKFVNYVRKQMHMKRCFYCDSPSKTWEALQQHLYDEQHFKMPKVEVFDQPEFYFPTYEDDAFLYLIDDVED